METEQLWSSVETKQKHMVLKTVRTSQTLTLRSGAQLCLQAHRRQHERIQVSQHLTCSSWVSRKP